MQIEEVENQRGVRSYWFPFSTGVNRLLFVLMIISVVMFWIGSEEFFFFFLVGSAEWILYFAFIWVYQGFKGDKK